MAKKTNDERELTSEDMQAINRRQLGLQLMAINQMATRAGFGSSMGRSYGDDRNLYEALGYPTDITFDDYFAKFRRSGYSKRVITAYPEASWSVKPLVYDDPDTSVSTAFEKEWESLVKTTRLWNSVYRADRLSGIGRYGAILLGINDGREPSEAVETRAGTKLLYMTPLTEGQITISTKECDVNEERYGQPLLYQVKFDSNCNSIAYHWTRIIHIAEDLVDSEIYGTPRLEAVYNNIIDLEKLTGGSAEMFWRGAFPGMSFNMDSDAEFDDAAMVDLRQQINDFIHGSTRVLRLQGVEPKEFIPRAVDPKSHVDIQLMEISALTGIPKRVLIGTEEGRLAGDQDSSHWNKRVYSRQVDYCVPSIMRNLIDRLILIGVLPAPMEDEYQVEFPELESVTPSEESTIDNNRILMIKNYIQSGMDHVIPVEMFLEKFIHLTKEEIDSVKEQVDELLEQERLDVEQFGLEQEGDTFEQGGAFKGGGNFERK